MNIGIIGAMKEEIEPLLEYYKEYEKIFVGKSIFYKIKKNNKTIFIVQSKIGKTFAAMTTTLLIDKFNCEHILFTGVAGGVDEDIEIGDIVLADKLVSHDFDITHFGHKKGHVPDFGIYSNSCDKLLNKAKLICDELKIKTHVGTIATGDIFINSYELKEEIKNEFNAKAIEMEGAAVGQICQSFNVPFLIIRSISDKASGEANLDFKKFVEIAAKNSSNIIIEMLK